MKKSILKRAASVVLSLSLAAQMGTAFSANLIAEEDISNMPLFNPDYSQLIARSDLVYEGRINKGSEGIPVANGRFGGPVWQPDGKTLVMQLNHTDCFMYNEASANTTTEGGCIGQVYVDFGGDVFDGETSQRLSLYDGKLSINSSDVNVGVIAYNDSDVVAIRVEDNRTDPKPITVDLKMVRQPNITRGEYSAITSFDTSDPDYAVLKQVFSEKCNTGIEVNDFYCAGAAALTVSDRDFEISSVGSQTMRLSLPASGGAFTVLIGGCSEMDDSVDVVDKALGNAKTSPDYDGIYKSNKEWWADFWSKSYIYLPSQQDFEKHRNYYMYLAAISNRGKYPSKYNGGIWIGEGDRRDWGAWYWNWNQDSLYQPFYDANHAELMEPYFYLRKSCYDQYAVAAQQLWGSEGIFVGETSGILGWETLPDNIAEDLREYYAGTGDLTPELEAFGNLRNYFLVPWNYRISFSGTSVSWVSHTMVATQETAEYYWNYYCYTKNTDWLRDCAYKFIKGAAEMYRSYYGFEKGSDGKYHISRTNLHEHLGGASDVVDDLSLARGTFAAAIESSKILDVDSELRKEWQNILDNLADYPLASDEDAIAFTDNNTDNLKIWAQGRNPTAYIRGLDGTESPKFKMLEKYDILNLETHDQKLDKGEWQIALNTYLASPGYTNQYLKQEEDKNGSSRFLADAAKLGRGDDLAIMFPTQYKAFYGTPNLLHDEGDYYSAEGYGTFSAALQLALNQSIAPTVDDDPVIRVFPAWPKAWDAKYKLAAKDGFLVSSSISNEFIEYIEIESQLGGKCNVRIPWAAKAVLYRNGVKETTVGGKENQLVSFDTAVGDVIVLVMEGTTPDQFRTSELRSDENFIVNDNESNVRYTGKWKYETGVDGTYLFDRHVTTEAGASCEYLFYGSGIDVIGEHGPDMGNIEIYIDGDLAATVDCNSDTAQSYKRIFSDISLEYTAHTVKLVNTDGKKLSVDGFRIWNAGNEQVDVINDTDERIVYNGDGWNYRDGRWMESDLMNDVHVTVKNGNSAEFTFIGTGIGLISEVCDDLGEADIYIDGEFKETINCYRAEGRISRQVVYSIKNLPYGEHTIKIEKKNGPYMIVDGFRIWLEAKESTELKPLANVIVMPKSKASGKACKVALPVAIIAAAAIAAGVVILKKKKKPGNRAE